MIVLGIDPGSRVTGWGIVKKEGSRLVHVASGVFRLGDGALAGRLKILSEQLEVVIVEHRPDVASVEMIFHAKNAQSALVLGHARGAALLTLARGGLEVVEYSALQIKQSSTGNGKAAKEQVQKMVQLLLGLRQKLIADEADGLAAAICHHHRSNALSARGIA